MKKQNNRPESLQKSSTHRSSAQRRAKPSSVSGKTEEGLTNLFTIDVPEMNLSPIKESRKPSVNRAETNSSSAKSSVTQKSNSVSRNSRTIRAQRIKSVTKSKAAKTEPNTSTRQKNGTHVADKSVKAKTLSPKPKVERSTVKRDTVRKTKVRIIPLGGLNEIGKNLTVIEC